MKYPLKLTFACSSSYVGLPSNDTHGWYYPSHGYASDEDDVDVRFSTAIGNWGRKTSRDARWVRHGKMAAWGPSMEDWEVCRVIVYVYCQTNCVQRSRSVHESVSNSCFQLSPIQMNLSRYPICVRRHLLSLLRIQPRTRNTSRIPLLSWTNP